MCDLKPLVCNTLSEHLRIEHLRLGLLLYVFPKTILAKLN